MKKEKEVKKTMLKEKEREGRGGNFSSWRTRPYQKVTLAAVAAEDVGAGAGDRGAGA